MMMLKINPELLSKKATHEMFDGTLVKLFTMDESFDFDGRKVGTAEIMNGADKGKYTTVVIEELIVI